MANPFDQFDAPSGGTIIRKPVDQFRVNDDARAAEAAGRAARGERRDVDSAGRADRGEQRDVTNTNFANVTKLRDSFNAREAVDRYKTVVPVIASGMKVASNPNATGADDLSLVYSFATAMDPNSVVREAEQAMVAQTGSFAQSLEGAISKLKSGDRFPPEVRRNLVMAMLNRQAQLKSAYDIERADFEGLAQRNGFNPVDVVGTKPESGYLQEMADFTGEGVKRDDGTMVWPKGMDPSKTKGADAGGGDKNFATGDRRLVPDKDVAGTIDKLVREGKNAGYINGELTRLYGRGGVSQAQVSEAQRFLQANPNYKGSFGSAMKYEQNTPTEQVLGAIAGDPVGSGAMTYLNAAGVGVPQLLGGDEAINIARGMNPKSAFIGDLAGSLTGSIGAGAALRGGAGLVGGVGGKILSNPLTADLAYSTAFGANTAGEGNRVAGAGIGATTALLGHGAGKYAVAPVIDKAANTGAGKAILSKFAGRDLATIPDAPPAALAEVAQAAGPRGPVAAWLDENRQLGIPATLADYNAGTQSLAGSVTRYSPDAAETARGMFGNRGRGQYDRLQNAMDRDFGPGANIPQQAADLLKQAETAAGPLYDKFRAGPAIGSPELESLLNTPAGRSALGPAKTIAGNKRVDPSALGFSIDDSGNVVLNPVASVNTDTLESTLSPEMSRQYTPETLDYVKRGLDDTLEQYRDPFGRLNLKGVGSSVNDVRGNLIKELDKLNPDYAPARAAYAGPVQAKDAFNEGVDAFGMRPDDIRFNFSQKPEHLQDQYRLGFRSEMGAKAGDVSLASNPFERVAGSPNKQGAIDTLFPETGPRFGRQVELERDLAKSTNAITGNSATQGRKVADDAYALSPGAAALDIGSGLLTGAPPTATLFSGARSLVKAGADKLRSNALRSKADEQAELLFNPDLAAVAPDLGNLIRDERLNRYLSDLSMRRSRMVGGMFGGAALAPATAYGVGAYGSQ